VLLINASDYAVTIQQVSDLHPFHADLGPDPGFENPDADPDPRIDFLQWKRMEKLLSFSNIFK